MSLRLAIYASLLLAATPVTALAQSDPDNIAAPVLRASIIVAGDLVRIGDVVDNAGTSARIAIYRAPDLGTTGSLPTAQVLAALRAHQVIGVDTKDIQAISVTRLARTLDSKDIELEVAHALEHKGGLGDAANLTLAFDREVQNLQLDVSNTGAMQLTAVHFEPRNSRFDVSFEIANESVSTPTRLRFTGTAVETVEAAIATRSLERGELIKSADVVTERRPKNEIGGEAASPNHTVGMQARRAIRAGQPLRTADLAKADLVVRDETVTLIFEAPGLYLTIRGKALENGAEGDIVNVINLTSQRNVSGIVVGRGRVSISAVSPGTAQAPAIGASAAADPAVPVAPVAVNPQPSAPKAE